MNDITWLESLASKTDYDAGVDEILNKQSIPIQMAYKANDQSALRNIFSNNSQLACKNTIFQ